MSQRYEQEIEAWYTTRSATLEWLDLADNPKPTLKSLAHNLDILFARTSLQSRVFLKKFAQLQELQHDYFEKLQSKLCHLEAELQRLDIDTAHPLTAQLTQKLVVVETASLKLSEEVRAQTTKVEALVTDLRQSTFMSSWTQTKESTTYRDALQATESLDPPALGFVRTDEVRGSTSGQTALLKQNNTLIQLLVKVSEQLEENREELHTIRAELSKATKGKAVDSEFEKTVSQLQNQLANLDLKGTIPKASTAPIRVYTDPLEIFKKEYSK